MRSAVLRLWGSLTRRRQDAQLTEEIEMHLDLLTEEFMAEGLPPAEARLKARREFGGVEFIKDSTRDARRLPLLESLAQDARFAVRQLRRNPSFTLTAILTLAIGIGGTTAIFSVIDIVILRPLPYPGADRLVALQETLPQFGPFPVSAAFWDEHGTSFDQIALASGMAVNLTGAGEPERLIAGTVTPNFLKMLGATAPLGRLLLDEEDQPGRDRVIVLSDALWRRRFNADPAIVGRTIELNGVGHEVVGVLAASFKAPNIKLLYSIPTREQIPEMWKPLALTPAERPSVGGYSFASVARLKPGVSLARAREELAAVQNTLVHRIPAKGELRAVVVPLQEQIASRSLAGLQLLLLAVATVLVIGCVNVANLLLARTIARRKEMSVREAIGAGRARIVRQLLVENLVLAAAGGAGGLVVAYGALRVLVSIAPADVPRLEEVSLDIRVLIFAGIVSIVCGFLVGLVPAWRAGRPDVHASLRGRGEASASLSALSVEGTTAVASERPSAGVRSVSPGYFGAMALPLLGGRLIEPADRERNVAVLSEQLARRGWPGQDPLGRRFRFGMNPAAAIYEVVGIVGDVRGTALDQPLTPTAYVPFPQRTFTGVSLIVRTAGDPSRLVPVVRQVLRAHDPELPIGTFRTMRDVVDESLASRRFQLLLVALFATLAGLLASLGVYGVMAYSVAQRRSEIGIRLALGARPGVVLRMVMREALTLTAAGLLVAVPIALSTGSFVRGFLVGVTPYEPTVLVATIAIIGVTALLAAAGPGLRASRVDPIVALRSE